ncbi:MAG: sulfur carrier protein ThiS [Planctomycetota bacterium]|nr:sulfur carrier protein ThiS [Planctomycetota bacterium]
MPTTPTIRIELNGAPRACPQGGTVAQLVQELGLRPEVVAIEVNQALVPRAERERRTLVEGDRIEVVTLVGGG